ncbi:DUF6443 domain-containing protein [Sphingobacterium sp. SRCM116780]|uniref:DUF6443 domain-containing protein n=1 Tax=Sphingobacterium sp. SRCM116780 TaxID=2907623 RepID=UPI001F40AC07|nr:DUF6443 domain-containing protein [Sphingobacterium sp. SRCM116780]UIR57826.1 DUF6443 domain-containing protein [Sphingobacterium sp. SRCM116780]
MKKYLSIFGVLSAVFITAQTNLTNTENYIYSKNCLNDDCTKSSENVQYFDSYGRPYQSIGIKASPTGKDVVQHIPYDSYGRSVDTWFPVPMTTTSGAVQDSSSVKSNALTVYGDSRPFSHTILENSPLNRALNQIPPGQEWLTHPVTMRYNANTANEVKKYTVSTTWIEGRTESALSLSGNYAANTLVKNTVTDEDGNISVEFKNKQGQIILVKKGVGTADNTDTYYVYNEYSQLVYVLPPLTASVTVTPDVLEKLCYQYRYDSWSRLVEKKIPGKGWEYMAYDKADRVILSQDSNLKAQGKWMITKYDPFGRLAYTGLISGGERVMMQSQITEAVVSEKRDLTGFMKNGIQIYYSNVYFFNLDTILSVNYYDTYPSYSFNPSAPATVYGSQILTDNVTSDINTKGVPVMSLVKNIEDDNWTKNYNWYNTKGKLVGTYAINHLGGYTKTESDVDFTGLVQRSKIYHKRLSSDSEKIISEKFEYDPQGRLKKHYHQVDSQPEELLSENTYNELSRLSNKKVGSNLQSIDYTYNVRGALTKINDPSILGANLFAYSLKYQNPVYVNLTSGKSNGYISEIDWNSASDGILKRYSYVYDPLNRLKDAIYTEPNTTTPYNNNYNENVTYDLNGNITTLKRNAFPVLGATSTLVDDLVYQYTGNRLDKVIENSLNDSGYEGGNNMIDYDLNGNMTNMKDKGIQNIIYNYLNLPDQLEIQNTNPIGKISTTNISVLYRADGVKLHKTYVLQAPMGLPTTQMTDYLDGFQYTYLDKGGSCITCRTENAYEEQAYRKIIPVVPSLPEWKLDFIPTAEGFYSFTENRYIYQYKDHLGNPRVSFARNSAGAPEILDTNNYYPFGLNHTGGNGLNSSAFGTWHSYKFNGKELQETGMYDFGARLYMPDLGRWGVLDPLAEEMRRHSPYNYAYNNPISFIDPDGRKPMIYNAGGVMRWEFDPLTTISGSAWFAGADFASQTAFAGSSLLSQGFTGGGGDGSDGSSTPGNKTYYGQDAYDMLQDILSKSDAGAQFSFSQFDFKQYGAEDCCPGGGLTATLAEGGAASRGGAVGFLWYAMNNVFGSAHIPNHADYAWRYTGSTPLTITEVKAEYKVREKNQGDGSYTIIFGNNHKYHGKGPLERMFTSAILQMTRYQTTVKSFDWTPSPTAREAFKSEYRRMQTDKVINLYDEGYKNPINYNMIQSPGKNYQSQDGY